MIIKEIHFLEIRQSFHDIFCSEFSTGKTAGELKTHLHNELAKQGVYGFSLELGLYSIILQFDPQFRKNVVQAFKVCKSF